MQREKHNVLLVYVTEENYQLNVMSQPNLIVKHVIKSVLLLFCLSYSTECCLERILCRIEVTDVFLEGFNLQFIREVSNSFPFFTFCDFFQPYHRIIYIFFSSSIETQNPKMTKKKKNQQIFLLHILTKLKHWNVKLTGPRNCLKFKISLQRQDYVEAQIWGRVQKIVLHWRSPRAQWPP